MCNTTREKPCLLYTSTCSSDTILRAIKELTQENISYTSDKGKTYDSNTADKLNTLLIKALVSTGDLNVPILPPIPLAIF